MARLFGTDGVRGVANADLTAELALGLSVAAAHVLAEAGTFEGHRPVAVVGRDPRASGEFLEAAVVAGLASAGVDVLRVGVLPTPAVAYLTGALGADLGVMLSASHNPMPDNGIKFFARGGHKLADELEDRIERTYRGHAPASPGSGRPAPGSAGSATTTRASTTTSRTSSACCPTASTACRSSWTARTARPPGSRRRRSPGRRRGRHHRRGPRRPEHQRRLRLHAPGRGCARPWSSTAPTSASRTTATPTAAWPWTRAATRSTATRSSRCWRWACGRPAALRQDTVVATVMSNLGFKLAMEREGISCVADGGRRPVRPGGDEGGRLRARRRAVRPRHHAGPRHDR